MAGGRGIGGSSDELSGNQEMFGCTTAGAHQHIRQSPPSPEMQKTYYRVQSLQFNRCNYWDAITWSLGDGIRYAPGCITVGGETALGIVDTAAD